MKKLKHLSIILCIILASANSVYCASTTQWTAQTAPYKIIINNKTFKTDKPIVTINNTTYLPLRAIGEALSVPINWNSGEKRVEIGKPSQKTTANVSAATGNTTFKSQYIAKKAPYKVTIEGKELKTSHPIVTVDGTTYLPLRAIGEALNVPINWNAAKRQVEIGKPKDAASTSSVPNIEFSVGTWSIDKDAPMGVYDIVRVTDVASIQIKDNFGKPFISTNYRSDNNTDGTTLKNVVLDKNYIIQVDAGKIKLVFKQNIVSSSVSSAAEYDHLMNDFRKFFPTYLEAYDDDYKPYARLVDNSISYELKYPTPDSKYYTASGYFYLSIGDGKAAAVQHKHTYIYKDDKWQLLKKEHLSPVVGEWRPCTDSHYCK